MRNQEVDATGENLDNDVWLPIGLDEEDPECDEIDKEIKRIFDDLRSIGSPQKYSLNEVLAKAIDAEKARLGNEAEIPGARPVSGLNGDGANRAFNSFRQFRLLYTTIGTAALGVIFCLCFLTSISLAGNEENSVAKNARFLHAENR